MVMLGRGGWTQRTQALLHRVPACGKKREHRMILGAAELHRRQQQKACQLPAHLPDLIEGDPRGRDIGQRAIIQPIWKTITGTVGRNRKANVRPWQGSAILNPSHARFPPVELRSINGPRKTCCSASQERIMLAARHATVASIIACTGWRTVVSP